MEYFSYPEFTFEQFTGSSLEFLQITIENKTKGIARNFLLVFLLISLCFMFTIIVTFMAAFGSLVLLR